MRDGPERGLGVEVEVGAGERGRWRNQKLNY